MMLASQAIGEVEGAYWRPVRGTASIDGGLGEVLLVNEAGESWTVVPLRAR
jgi:hypothetical protein